MKARLLLVAATFVAACSAPGKKSDGLWESNAPKLPIKAAGWSGGLAADGSLYAFTGASLGTAGSALYALSPSSGTWSFVSQDPYEFAGSATAMLDGVFYECGPTPDASTIDCASYNAASSSWTLVGGSAALPSGIMISPNVAATNFGDSVIIFLTFGQGSPCCLGGAVRYTPSSGVWTVLAGAPYQINFPVAIPVGNLIYVFFGDSSSYFVLDPFANTWTSSQASAQGTLPLACRSVAETPRGIFGVSNPDTLGIIDVAAATGDDLFAAFEKLPTPRYGACPITDGERIFVLGGWSDGTMTEAVDDVDVFVP